MNLNNPALFPKEDLDLLLTIKKYIEKIPEDIDLGKDFLDRKISMSCHILSHAIAKISKLEHVDGYLYPNFNHSWIITKNLNIIDVYPIGIANGPILVSGNMQAPSTWHYIPDPDRSFLRFLKSKHFKVAVRRTVDAMTK